MQAAAMTDGNPHDQIASLEADIEQLAEGLERCRKAMLLSKVAIGAGGICILAYFLGIRLDPTILIGALAAIIGGVVVFGSNLATSKQTKAAMKDAEAKRTELIGLIDLRTVGAAPTNHSSH
jgi:biotin transporter BioY